MQTQDTTLIIGAGSRIAQSLLDTLLDRRSPDSTDGDEIVLISRTAPRGPQQHGVRHIACDYSEHSIHAVVESLQGYRGRIRRVFICNGILHSGNVSPEKRLEDIQLQSLRTVFTANAFTPLLWLQGLCPLLKATQPCIVTVFSARIGSIGDNRLGGWYSYRGAKAALNMLLKTAAIEYARRAPNVKLIAFHPGTTDTPLSKPFQASVPEGKLFSPDFVAEQLLAIVAQAQPDGELSYLDWAGEPIQW